MSGAKSYDNVSRVFAAEIERGQARAIASVLDERDRQDEKFGPQRDIPIDQWNTILTEEVLEALLPVARSVNDRDALDDLRAELVQVAAVAVNWIEQIDAGRVEITDRP